MLEDLCEPALSIQLNHSQDSESSDIPSSPDKDKDHFKVKCFRCFGSNNPYCNECNGTEMITSMHPLAFLLNEVLLRKLNLKKTESITSDQEHVYPIQEEEEELDERRMACSCFERKCECQNRQSMSAQRIDKNSPNSFVYGETSGRDQLKSCFNCHSKIQNCYSICKTCQSQLVQYWICDVCSDHNCYSHPLDHVFEPVFDYDDNKIETISQQFEEEPCDNEDNFNDLPEENGILFDKKNSSIANYLEDETILQINNSSQINSKPEVNSRVKFELQGLFSSYEFKSSMKINKSPNKQTPSPSRHKKSSAAKQNLNGGHRKPAYVFVDYKCDYCQMQPILNIRYHCNNCEDFDLCENCYEECDSVHEHDSFEKIDGRLFREKAMEKLFQSRDINLKSSFAPDACPRKVKKTKTMHFESQFQNIS